MANVLPPDNALSFLKADLGYFNSTIPEDLERYLAGLVFKANRDLRGMGIQLSTGDAADDQFVAAYAAWLYRNKKGDGKPQSLKEEIKNRQMNQALSGDS